MAESGSTLIVWEPQDWLALAAAIGTVVALVLSYVLNTRTLRASRHSSEAAMWQKTNETELKSINDLLDSFYGPLVQKSETNSLLARDLRSRQADPGTFILIEKIFDREWRSKLSDGERALVEELVANAKEIRELIGRAPMSAALIPFLARAVTHYRILELAWLGKLGDHARPWLDLYVYPRQVDQVVNLEVGRLERRAALLRNRPANQPPANEALAIPSELQLKPWVDPPRRDRPELAAPLR